MKCQFCPTVADFEDYFIKNKCDFCKETTYTCVNCHLKLNLHLKPECENCERTACCMNSLCLSMVQKFLKTTYDNEVMCKECVDELNIATWNDTDDGYYFDCERCHRYMCSCCYCDKCQVCRKRICNVCIENNGNTKACIECVV